MTRTQAPCWFLARSLPKAHDSIISSRCHHGSSSAVRVMMPSFLGPTTSFPVERRAPFRFGQMVASLTWQPECRRVADPGCCSVPTSFQHGLVQGAKRVLDFFREPVRQGRS